MSKPMNFNDLKGDNITEIIKYLHPHTEENERLKKELIKYMDFEQKVKQMIESEYHFSLPHRVICGDGEVRRVFTRKKIADEETHKNLFDICNFTQYESLVAKKLHLKKKIKGREELVKMKIDEKERILSRYNKAIEDNKKKVRKMKSELDKLF
jgi:hypothetical protein